MSGSEDPDALNQLGRIRAEAGDAAMALALQRHVLRLAPGHRRAKDDLAAAGAAIVSPHAAEEAYAAAVAREPDIAVHHRDVGALRRFVAMETVAAMLDDAIAADPGHARAHAARANLAARAGDRAAAMRSYALAVMLDWDFAEAQLALAQLYDTAGNAADAARHLHAALTRRTLYESRAPHAVRTVLVLKAPGSFLANALLDFCIDPNRTNLDVLYCTADVAALPARANDDVVINAMAATEAHVPAIVRSIALLAAKSVMAINPPAHLERVRRAALPHTLRDVPSCFTPPVRRVSRADVARAFAAEDARPSVLRPVDAQRGDDFERIATRPELDAYLARVASAAFTLGPFVDYRSPDGFYRKYRVVVVDGVPYPYHLAISAEWLVHYWRVSDAMRATDWMRAEEERFFEAPATVFPTWEATFGAIAAAAGIDYFAVDCARRPDGSVLVFECDPGAFVHCHADVDGVFAYKLRYVPRIFAALDELLERRITAPGARRPRG